MKTIEYERTRLYFDADLIEPLNWDDVIRIITPEGTFRMTKRQFYDTFSNVVKTMSYRRRKHYHYPKTPEKALQFLLKPAPR